MELNLKGDVLECEIFGKLSTDELNTTSPPPLVPSMNMHQPMR